MVENLNELSQNPVLSSKPKLQNEPFGHSADPPVQGNTSEKENLHIPNPTPPAKIRTTKVINHPVRIFFLL